MATMSGTIAPMIALTDVWAAGRWEEEEPQRTLATVLFTDIVGSSERAAALGDRGWGRVASQAQPGEVLVSSTVKDLVAGSRIEFRDRGRAELKGIPGEWHLYAVGGALR